ncbi:hypothetical protein IFM89_015621 [Coptis chinensis]|uniref:Uncharacterized protein n=1 Tax=Coptis chinensis TaxID=261450 RepID=A0A835I2L4_9MAGN|nr:hypothetical protein IFM89_015621 [Coptis chinensis]
MREEEVNRCQIQELYPIFKSVSIKTLIHELPETFVHQLRDDSGPFMLPQSISGEDALPRRIHNPEEEEDFQVTEGSEEQPPSPPSFPEFELGIKESILVELFPKLNWSTPKDSAWISTTGNLKCTSFSEITPLYDPQYHCFMIFDMPMNLAPIGLHLDLQHFSCPTKVRYALQHSWQADCSGQIWKEAGKKREREEGGKEEREEEQGHGSTNDWNSVENDGL